MSAGCARRSTAVTIPIQSAPSAVPAMRSMTGLGRRRDWSRCRPAVSKRVEPRQSAGADRSTPERSPVAAHMGRLIGDARVVRAIGQAGDGLAAAKEEIGIAWIADGPAAGLLVEFEQRAALAERDDVVEQLRFQLDIEFVGLGERGVAPYRRPRDPQHVGMGARLARARSDSPSRCTLPITALRVMPPSSAAIWLADNPSVQSFFSVSTRSSVQVMPQIPRQSPRRRSPDRIPLRAWTTTSWPDAYPRHRFTL